MFSSDQLLALRSNTRGQLVLCAVAIAALSSLGVVMAFAVPWAKGPDSLLDVSLAHVAFWSIWVGALYLTHVVRRRTLLRFPRQPLPARIALEVAFGLTFAVAAGLTAHAVVLHTFGPPPVPEALEPYMRPMLVVRAALFYVLTQLVRTSLASASLRRERERAVREKEAVEAHLAAAQLQVLHAQVQPHCLFNSLHGIGALVLEGENDRAHAALVALASLLRSTFRHDDGPSVAARREIALIENYLSLMKIRLGDRLTYECTVDEDARDAEVPTLLLLPIVENAVQHGIGPKVDGGRIAVEVRREGTRVAVTVTDDGVGFDPKSARGSGVGLRNCRERLQRIHGARACVTVEAREGGGTRVRMRFPAAVPAVEEHESADVPAGALA
ncbi:MAG: histidine kinase [Planctomycetota bacterium]